MTLHMAFLSTAVPLPRPFALGRHFQAGAPARTRTWFLVVFNAQPRMGLSDKTKWVSLRSWGNSSGIPPPTILFCQCNPPPVDAAWGQEGREGGISLQGHKPGSKICPVLAGISTCFPVRHAGNPTAVSVLLQNLIPWSSPIETEGLIYENKL